MQYVAFLRGIGPGVPNMRNEKLRGVFEGLGYTNVRSVISSGNIMFESNSTNVRQMEEKIEATWPMQLGFNSTTIIRSQRQLQELKRVNPFEGLRHGPSSYLMVTFLQAAPKVAFQYPHYPKDKPYFLPKATQQEVFSITDNTIVPTTDLMVWLEKQFGKNISSRSWQTIQKIIARF